MKRMIASAGLLAIGAASAYAAGYAPGFASTDSSKPWSVSATLRGFYDDNIYTAPDNPPPGTAGPQSSWGFSVVPTVSTAFSTDQTEFGARFTFVGDWYANRPNSASQWDDSYIFDMYLGHTFSPRVNMFIADQFTYSQEPDVISQSGATTLPFRTDNNNLHNNGSITANIQMTELMALVLGYANNYYSYSQTPQDITDPTTNPFGVGSYASLLNRVENLFKVEVQRQFTPTTAGLLGAMFNMVNYTDDGSLYNTNGTASTNPSGLVPSDTKNQNQFTVYAGANHSFNPDFSGSLRVGGQYFDQYNVNPSFTGWAPYADLSLQYQYGVGSYLSAGFSQSFQQTYLVAANSSSSIAYAAINHAFTPKLTGRVAGTYQFNDYNSPPTPGQPSYDGATSQYWDVSVGLTYQFDRHLFANAQYIFSSNDSDNPTIYSYTRNRIFFGVGATY